MEKMVEKMVQHHNFMIETNHKLTDSMDRYNENIGGMVHGINEINENLNRGFRLRRGYELQFQKWVPCH